MTANWHGFVPSDYILFFVNSAIEHVLDITTPYICGVIKRQVAFAWNFPVELDEINVRTNYIMRIFDCYLKSVRDCVRTFEQGSSCDDECDAKDVVARSKHSWTKSPAAQNRYSSSAAQNTRANKGENTKCTLSS